MNNIPALLDKAKSLPAQPGVYLMKNKKNEVIYVGKAKKLSSRVASYFQLSGSNHSKTAVLVQHIDHFEYITTINEIEALILESNLIKKFKPKYNISLKDDKRYPYILITNDNFPKIIVTRKMIKGMGAFFGPYTEVKELRIILKSLRNIFQYRDCNIDSAKFGNLSPCMNYQIHRCQAPCAGLISQAEYNENIQMIIDFLNGNIDYLINLLKKKMKESSEKEEFEKAAKWRDLIKKIVKVTEKQTVSNDKKTNTDFISISVSGKYACIAVFQIRTGQLMGKQHFFLENLDLFQANEAIEFFIEQYYLEQEWAPDKIFINSELPDQNLLESWLAQKDNKKTIIVQNPKGNNYQLMKLVSKNSAYYLEDFLINKVKTTGKIHYSVQALQKNLNLPKAPYRIEAFDISHLSGKQMVGSAICFINGKPDKSEYRQFHIKTVKGIDDFKAIYETVLRKYQRSIKQNLDLPDLIVIDGGANQLSFAKKAMSELELESIPMISIAKKFEEIYFPNKKEPIILPKTSAALRLIQAIRDESHRFAVKNHTKWRSKEFTLSILDEIEGIGKNRKRILLTTFASIKEISDSDEETLKNKTDFPEKIVKNIYNFFHYKEFGIIRNKYGF